MPGKTVQWRIVCVLGLAALVVGCKGKPPKAPNIKWQPATVETLDAAKKEAMPCMIFLTDGTQKMDYMLWTKLAHEPVEKAVSGFACIKCDFTKKDDPLVKKITDWQFNVKALPSILFIRSTGMPGELTPATITQGEMMTKMMQVR